MRQPVSLVCCSSDTDTERDRRTQSAEIGHIVADRSVELAAVRCIAPAVAAADIVDTCRS